MPKNSKIFPIGKKIYCCTSINVALFPIGKIYLIFYDYRLVDWLAGWLAGLSNRSKPSDR